MKSYAKYWEYRITIGSASEDEYIRFVSDPRLNPICVCKEHAMANRRFLKNLRRPNRVRNVKYTMECWNRHLIKKKKKKG